MFYTAEEIKNYEEKLALLIRKRDFIMKERVTAVDVNAKFAIEEELTKLEQEIADLKELLSKAHGIPAGVTASNSLESLAKALNIDEDEEIGMLHLVNCDRKQMRSKFWDAFDEKEKEHFQFYFISACPSQMPPSFAERMVYELLVEELNGNTDALHIVQHEDSGRIKIQDLPMGRNVRKSQQRFKEYVQERFRFADTQSFDAFIETGVPNLPYDYVSVIFEIHERKWESFLEEYLQWMIDTFRCPHEDVPKFLFFFVVYIDGQHLDKLSGEQRQIIDILQGIDHRNDSTLLTPLMPVEEADLRAWLMDLGERNPNKVEELIEAFVAGLREEDKILYQKGQLFNMKDIEELQALIYRIANE
ncbi:MAG: hypothetical protein MI974_18980 [Chitinophagales bacterium]|nr:hypothetical protein [Chitinophagales bacterium]